MAGASLLRKLASLLLLVCFVLPLSKCGPRKAEPVVGNVYSAAVTAPPHAEVAKFEDVIWYGYEVLEDLVTRVAAGKFREMPFLIVMVVAFFVPAATMGLREPWRSTCQLLAPFPSLYVLQVLTFIGTPQFGGLLALTCWVILLILSTWSLWRSFRWHATAATTDHDTA